MKIISTRLCILFLLFQFSSGIMAQNSEQSDVETTSVTELEKLESRLSQKVERSIGKFFCLNSITRKLEELDIVDLEIEAEKFVIKGQFAFNCGNRYNMRTTIRFVANAKKVLGDFLVLNIKVDPENTGIFNKQIYPME